MSMSDVVQKLVEPRHMRLGQLDAACQIEGYIMCIYNLYLIFRLA